MTKNCPLCNSTATDRDDTMYAKGGVCCDNMDCCLHTVGIPADEWNSRPIDPVFGKSMGMLRDAIIAYREKVRNLEVLLLDREVEIERLESEKLCLIKGNDPEVTAELHEEVPMGSETETFSVPLPVGISQETIDTIVEQSDAKLKRPWWKFWGKK